MAVSTALATTKLAAGGGAGLGLLAAGSGLMAPLLVTTAALAAVAYAGFRYVTWPTCGKCACEVKPRGSRDAGPRKQG